MVRFDDSLQVLVRKVAELLGRDLLSTGTVLRDATGRLSFFCSAELDETMHSNLTEALRIELGPYAGKDRVVVSSSEYGASRVLQDNKAIKIKVGDFLIRLIDRRIVGADWLRAPVRLAPPPPRFVFSSIKGGVGRSTALAVAASALSRQGLRVLAIDLDIEAPGLGPILLNNDTLPEFGLIDALVENGISSLDRQFLADLIGPSDLSNGRGRIDVIPVLGKRSLNNPGDVLSKIARAYMEDIREDGSVATILDQISELIDYFSDSRQYDAILVDARAGLHETTASAILGMGAEVLLFGLDEPQTFQGFKILLSHMARFGDEGAVPEWLSRFTIVQGKAPSELESRQRFADQCRSLFADLGLVEKPDICNPESFSQEIGFGDIEWNDEASDEDILPKEDYQYLEPLAILDDPKFKGFNPQAHTDLLESGVYVAAYEQLLAKIRATIPDSLEGINP
ncbi:CobQ/CobB/MinD/ParA nucleotide binding domain-containing protein [Geopseudomonas sagittaria]|uniref:CobQ/CobB/MinD/ParA nucleotide binding domain-containing protein n=1 Tax=Geopseudomonas sagittaria TaxID=1135990 RepID=A0A1I5WRG2_9GAMM|nr:hypothetical protein [Pseudomonas sagittaria]SFQ22364.1 CobQ/CobB/MinD/ParA nucleotide binding domain-containing protein [Pseudomonas sagittaria]